VIHESCGEPRGYVVHFKAGEPACEDCLHARRTYMRWWRFLKGKQHSPFHCDNCGSVFYEHNCALAVNNSQLFTEE